MPYANNNGTRIHHEVEGVGPPLLLQRGTTGSWEDWAEFGYAQPLGKEYQLILVDARGSGASDKPHDAAAYDLAVRAADIVAVLDDLGIPKTHFFGYSPGGWIGFGLARYAPDRIRSLVIGGAHPYYEDMQPIRDRMPQETEAFMTSMERMYKDHLTPALLARVRQNDLQALMVMTQDRPSVAETLPTMTMPCLLFAGEADPRLAQMRECTANPSSATIFSLPELDHAAAFLASNLVLPHVQAFLANVGPPSAR